MTYKSVGDATQTDIEKALESKQVGEKEISLESGKAFIAGHRWEGVSDGDTVQTIFQNPSYSEFDCNLASYDLESDGKVNVDSFIDRTVSAEGTDIPEKNRNIGNDRTSRTDILIDGTYSGGETGPTWQFGTGGRRFRSAGASKTDAIKIQSDHNFGLNLVNDSGDSSDISFRVKWYEKRP